MANLQYYLPHRKKLTPIYLLLVSIFSFSCFNEDHLKQKNLSQRPIYDSIAVSETKDTLNFPLPEDLYNQIKSLNYFINQGKGYVSFFDRGSQSIAIYDFKDQSLYKRLFLKKLFKKERLYKTSVFVKNIDTIVIINNAKLYFTDTSGKLNHITSFPAKKNGYVDNTNPPVFSGKFLYLPVMLTVKETSLAKIRNWDVLYKVDLTRHNISTIYPLPEFYGRDYYGRRFLQSYLCLNDHGSLVLSFAADSMAHETDLHTYNNSFYARSRFQLGTIQPVPKGDLDSEQGAKAFELRDAYGPIYFDQINRRYLRIFKQKVSESEYQSKIIRRKQSIIVFNESFQIIGELPIHHGVYDNFLIVDDKGTLYARVKASDEYAIHFLRLQYTTILNAKQLAQK